MNRVYRKPLLCFLVVLSMTMGTRCAIAQTDNTGNTNTATIPDPAALSADWWQYLQSAGEARGQRIAALQANLDTLAASLTQVGTEEDRSSAFISSAAQASRSGMRMLAAINAC